MISLNVSVIESELYPSFTDKLESSQNILFITNAEVRIYISDLTTTFKNDLKFSEIKHRKD